LTPQHCWAIGLNDSFWQNNQGRWTQCQIPLPSGEAQQISAGTDGTVWALDEVGNAYAMAASPMQTAPALTGKMAPVTIRKSSNLLYLFCIDQAGALWAIGQRTSAGGWGSWISLGAPAGLSLATLAAGSNQDGRLQVFAVGSDESLHTIWETAPNVWSGWDVLTPPTGTPLVAVAAGHNADGRLEVAALGKQDGAVYHISQTAPNNGWGTWSSLGAPSGTGVSPAALAIASQADGRLTVFAGGTGKTPVSCITQTTPGNGWGGWTAVWHITDPTNAEVQTLAVGRNPDGRLEVFCLATTNRPGVWHGFQQTPNGSWGPWSVMGGLGAERPNVALGVGQNADGRLEVFVSDSAGTVWHDWQTSPGSGTWSGWASLGTPAGVQIQSLTILQDRSGRLSALGLTANGVLWQVQQATPNGAAGWGSWLSTWSAWSAVNAPALKHPPTGTANACWAIDNNGAVMNWNCNGAPSPSRNPSRLLGFPSGRMAPFGRSIRAGRCINV
jgi:hypothetical protein